MMVTEEASDWEETTGLTFEDFMELNNIINITSANDVEEILELYKTSNSNASYSGNFSPPFFNEILGF